MTALSSWLRDASRYGLLALALCILGLAVLVVLLVQPSPLTFAEGWSTPREIAEVKLGHPHRAAVDRRGQIHLIWQRQVDRKLVVFYALLDRQGQFIVQPRRLSDADANAEDVALALTSQDTALCFWIEKGHEDGSQRLVMARPEAEASPQTLSTSSQILRDLVATGDEQGRVYLAWSDNRQGLYDIYMTALDDRGHLLLNERRITDSGQAFVFEPALAAGDGIVHLVYFADRVTDQELVHQAYDLTGEPLTEPLVLERVSQVGADLGAGGEHSYPLLAVAEARGQLRLYESLGRTVRQRKIDRDGQVTLPAEPLLSGSQHYSQVNLAQTNGQRWLIWADLRLSSGERFQVYAAPLDEAGHVGEQTRLTFAPSSALWPVLLLDGEGGAHAIWQQSTGPYAYQLMYINNLHPGRISAWQRLGFSSVGGGWSFLLASAEAAFLAVVTAALNIWRLALAWAVTVLALQIAQRVEKVRLHRNVVAWFVLLAALFAIVRPEAKTLGQMPIVVVHAAHWVMGAAASAMALYLGWVWREAFRYILIWAGVGGVWVWVYYFLNLVLILREGFAL